MTNKSKLQKMWDRMTEVYPFQLQYLNACLNVNELEFVDDPLPWQVQGLTFTASGYGDKIPTTRKVKAWGRYYRVYCRVWSNIGTCYIIANNKIYIVD